MNTDTKRHIDAARQVLVGVVPNPTSQIDQITNALIYKFMDDMDQAAIKQGGEPAFFVGDLERYAWTRLMDTRMGNQERMNLYSEALIKFSEARQLPELFRGIFKSAFLPYRSPDVLGLFLKEIDFFDYSHPEELGNAYEYLLSIMSSQGDAGQFRTPRHIIDFIVDVVDPTKDDRVLDPACGTGGFLVSSYTHIIEKHDGKDDPEHKEKPLTPDERKKLMNNFEGYDIDPTMARIAQVNMYLHQFKNPKIYQYNTLADEERWSEKYDVILANPPFMSPKGAGKPHSKFSIDSSRSEVLFVDYIMNHLRPKGRAGIIVPEGIIFQSGTGHKQLRKNLVEDGLYAVVSLPSGVFQPYSGVKTSILLFDNELAKKNTEMLFIDIKDTGVSLGATQRLIEKNDLTEASLLIKKFQNGISFEQKRIAFTAHKDEIATLDYDLSLSKYRKKTSTNSDKPFVALSTVCHISKGKSSSTQTPQGAYPLFLTAEDCKTSDHFDFDGEGVAVPLISATGHGKAAIKRVHHVKGKFALANLLAFVEPKNAYELSSMFLFYVLDSAKDEMAKIMNGAANVSMKTDDLEAFQIPLPPLEVQEQVVTELDGYQGIIAGAKQIVQNWKPQIDIDQEWEKAKLGDVCAIKTGKKDVNQGNPEGQYPFFTCAKEPTCSDTYSFDTEALLVAGNGDVGAVKYYKGKFEAYQRTYILDTFKENVLPMFLFYYLDTTLKPVVSAQKLGNTMPYIKLGMLSDFETPLPPLTIQKQIVEKIEAERTLVDSAKRLIDIYEQKTKAVVAKLWSE